MMKRGFTLVELLVVLLILGVLVAWQYLGTCSQLRLPNALHLRPISRNNQSARGL